MNERGDVAVVGAGLIGLGIAFELAERGATVAVYDRAEPARAASWAGAGMLAPHTEGVRDEDLLELCEASLAEYPAFVERVREAGGIDPQLHLDGVVETAFDDRAFEAMRRRADELRERGVARDVLERDALLAAEPWLGPRVTGGLLLRGEGYVDNRRFGRALVAACHARGVTIVRAQSVCVECDARRVLGVRTDLGFRSSGAVVNACGAWAAQLDGIPADALPRVEPVKGQMFALEVPLGLVKRPTWVPGAYVVPRDDGRLLVGATVERVGYDARVTAGGLETLLHSALAAAPALAGFTVSETWAGLRPATPDGLPYLGPTRIDGLFVATGHFRNGILLAPSTARLLAGAILDGPQSELHPFLPERTLSQRITAS